MVAKKPLVETPGQESFAQALGIDSNACRQRDVRISRHQRRIRKCLGQRVAAEQAVPHRDDDDDVAEVRAERFGEQREFLIVSFYCFRRPLLSRASRASRVDAGLDSAHVHSGGGESVHP